MSDVSHIDTLIAKKIDCERKKLTLKSSHAKFVIYGLLDTNYRNRAVISF